MYLQSGYLEHPINPPIFPTLIPKSPLPSCVQLVHEVHFVFIPSSFLLKITGESSSFITSITSLLGLLITSSINF